MAAGSVLTKPPEGEPEGWLSGCEATARPLRAKWWLPPFCCEKSCVRITT